jgi:DNA polymerase I-like protein with 3'-5' exonuclease and polymerase domains
LDLITLDLETYYDQQYSLSKLTTEEYIRDPRFSVIGVGTKVNDEVTQWVTGDAATVLAHLRALPWDNAMLLAHNTMFDGAILSWRCGIRPKALADTMLMSRALFGTEVSHSLKAVSERYGVGQKGDEVVRALGKRRQDFYAEDLARYGQYCANDVQLTYDIFQRMLSDGFPIKELKLIDVTLRMFTEPMLDLDGAHLRKHLQDVRDRKQALLDAADIADKKDLMSNQKFADMLREFGVEPPMKVSPTTGKETYAFAKTDEDFKALEEHEDERVQTIVAARLGNKSTLEETRTERFLQIASRGTLPVPIRYYAAHTGRWGGSDKINLQNLPSRGANAKQIKQSIVAPSGYVLIDADSAQIEARVLAWLAEQDDVVATFAANGDVYKRMASQIFDVPEGEITKEQRQIGKVVILGAGYGVGHNKLQLFLKMQAGVEVDLDEAKRIIDIYRSTNSNISGLWRDAQDMLRYLVSGQSVQFGRPGVLTVNADEGGVRLPSGLYIRYPNLKMDRTDTGTEFHYKVRKGRNYIYGGKVVENVTQALARCIVGEQMLKIAEKYRVVLTVHDSVVCCVRENEAEEAQAYVEQCMRWTPDWAAGLPVNCESDIGRRYGE